MKKILFALLALTLCFAMFVGCNEPAETPVDAPVEENTEAPAEENTEAPAEENTEAPAEAIVVAPLPATLDVATLDNCTVAVSLAQGDAYVDDNGAMQMKVTVYDYDLYDMVDVAALKEGDSIMRLDEEVKITSIERMETGLIVINGGEENGGFDLFTDDSTVYFEMGMDNIKAYYPIGEATIPVSTEFVYTDASNLDAEPVEYFPGDFLTEDAGIVYDFNQHNTTITIAEGKVVAMNKQYRP